MNARVKETKEWVSKAAHDLRGAIILRGHDPPEMGLACFHSQQAVEKILKAYLVWQQVEFRPLHNLTYLHDLCQKQDIQFEQLKDRIELLQPYAVEVRYPGPIEVSTEEANEVFEVAEAAWKLTMDRLPESVKAEQCLNGNVS